uniref:Succinate dehydrogenase subunit 4 n=1 Tax=Goniomonas avonlea TaxID=1255295 RepID=A0A348G6L4_9CRYP|nr:succinate dehydrogenase subunit 4 [Goniomonas avonlea]
MYYLSFFWWSERLSSVFLVVPIFFLGNFFFVTPIVFFCFFGVLIFLFVVFFHIRVGFEILFEDYIKTISAIKFSLFILDLFCIYGLKSSFLFLFF